jgi:hypothetical protein
MTFYYYITDIYDPTPSFSQRLEVIDDVPDPATQ